MTYTTTPQPAPKKTKTLKILLLVLLALALLAAGLYYVKSASDKIDHDRAKEACIEDVTDHAKYPGGRSFPDGDPSPVTEDGWLDNPRTYTAEGAVDFVNGFGAPVRYAYSCTADITSAGEVARSLARVEKR